MSDVNKRWCKLAGLLTEQLDAASGDPNPRMGIDSMPSRDLHVFDFDDTLGVTTSPTLVAAVEYNGGDPDDPTSYAPVKDLGSRVGSKIKGIKSPQQSGLNSPGLSGNNVRSNDELDDAEAIVLDTEQYRDWKEKYIPGGDHVRLVISPNVSNDIRRAGRAMFDQGKTGEIHIADFSPSSTIGTDVKPIENMLDVFQAAENDGAMTAVVTARKGKTDLDALGGGKIPATNAADIQDFLASELGTNADVVYGAADFNPTDPATAKKDLIGKVHNPNIENIHFYDDDPENARRVAQLCHDDAAEGLEGTELDIYNYEFAKGETPTDPTFSCTIGEERIRTLVYKVKKQNQDAILQEGIFQDAMSFIKEKGKAAVSSTKDFLLKLKQEMSETKESAKLLGKVAAGQKLSPQEKEELKIQVKDIGKGLPLLGLLALPGGGIATVALVKLAKKFNIDLTPTAFQDVVVETKTTKIKMSKKQLRKIIREAIYTEISEHRKRNAL